MRMLDLTENAIALGAPSVLATWGFDFLKEVCAHLQDQIDVRLIDRDDEVGAPGQRFFCFSHFTSPSLRAVMNSGTAPIVLFLDDPCDSVRYLKLSADCSMIEALRIQTAAAAGHASLFGSPAVLAVHRLQSGPTQAILSLMLKHLRLDLPSSIYETLVAKFVGPGDENTALETSLRNYVVGYEPLDCVPTILTAEEVQIINDVLAPVILMSISENAAPVVWPTKIFFSGDRLEAPAPLAADLTGGARILYYGPYLHLPAGRWTVRMIVGFSAGSRGTPFSVEVYGGNLLARAIMVAEAKGIFNASFEFTHDAPYEAIEIRLRTDRGAIEGQFALGRVELSRQKV
jgi:hypothetical protein